MKRTMPRGTLVLIFPLMLLLLTSCADFQTKSSGMGSVASGDGYPQPPYTFADEFDGPLGASPNFRLGKTYWFSDTCWSSGCGNQSPTEYVPADAYLDGLGHLVLEAKAGSTALCGNVACSYTSGALTMFNPDRSDTPSWSQQYGTFAARIKIDNASQGLWPAFWMEGENKGRVGWPMDGEIDAFEAVGQNPTIVRQFIEGGRILQTLGRGWPLSKGESIADWHVYSITWTSSRIQWAVDGHITLAISAAQVGAAWATSFQHPFAIRLDLTVGGNLPGVTDTSSKFPAKMLIDWVRVSAA